MTPWRSSIVVLSGVLAGLASPDADACMKGPRSIKRGVPHGHLVPAGPTTPTIFPGEIPEPSRLVPQRSPGVWWWRPTRCPTPEVEVARWVDGGWRSVAVEPLRSDIEDDDGAGWWLRPEEGWVVGSAYHVEASCGRCSEGLCELGRDSIATELRVVATEEEATPTVPRAAASEGEEDGVPSVPVWPVFVVGLANLVGLFALGRARSS